MLIGKDYPKFEFDFLGLHLMELNGFIGDILIFILAIYFYLKIKNDRFEGQTPFMINWRRFYLWFGISFLLGGFGHLFFFYWEIWGKFPSWILGMLASFYIEQAMFSIYPNPAKRKPFKVASVVKLIAFCAMQTILVLTVDITYKPELGMILPTLSSTIGLVFCLGVLGVFYQKRLHDGFKFLWYSVIVLFITVIPQAMKINPHPFFDRNDVSHILLLLSLVLYYQTIKRVKL